MGSSNSCCPISKISISYKDEVKLFIVKKNPYGFVLGGGYQPFVPLFFPINAIYDDRQIFNISDESKKNIDLLDRVMLDLREACQFKNVSDDDIKKLDSYFYLDVEGKKEIFTLMQELINEEQVLIKGQPVYIMAIHKGIYEHLTKSCKLVGSDLLKSETMKEEILKSKVFHYLKDIIYIEKEDEKKKNKDLMEEIEHIELGNLPECFKKIGMRNFVSKRKVMNLSYLRPCDYHYFNEEIIEDFIFDLNLFALNIILYPSMNSGQQDYFVEHSKFLEEIENLITYKTNKY